MTPKMLLSAALFASLAIARPRPMTGKIFKPGWCTFHLDEDAVPATGLYGPEHKIGIRFYDADHDNFYNFPQTNFGDYLQDIRVLPDKFPGPIIMSSLPDGFDGHLQGWEFEYNGEKWTTNDENHCSAGAEAVSGFGWRVELQLRQWRGVLTSSLPCRSRRLSGWRGITTAALLAKKQRLKTG